MSYYIYAKTKSPQELNNKYPNAACYLDGRINLFVESLEEVTGAVSAGEVDLESMSNSDLDSFFDSFIQNIDNEIPDTSELKISKVQGAYLYNTRFYVPLDDGV